MQIFWTFIERLDEIKEAISPWQFLEMQRALKGLNRATSFFAFQFSAFCIISTVSISYEGFTLGF